MTMQFAYATNITCAIATGTVVVIDVLRAFTTAAFAFAAGASEILLVSTVAEALALRERFPASLVMGEVDGLPVAGFDFSNSPGDLVGRDFAGARFIQRTSAGTQGVVRSTGAKHLLVSTLWWLVPLHGLCSSSRPQPSPSLLRACTPVATVTKTLPVLITWVR